MKHLTQLTCISVWFIFFQYTKCVVCLVDYCIFRPHDTKLVKVRKKKKENKEKNDKFRTNGKSQETRTVRALHLSLYMITNCYTHFIQFLPYTTTTNLAFTMSSLLHGAVLSWGVLPKGFDLHGVCK